MFYGPGGSKSRLAKAAGAEPSGHVRGQKLHAAVARSTFLRFSKQKCAKRFSFGVLLEVEMLKRRAIFLIFIFLFSSLAFVAFVGVWLLWLYHALPCFTYLSI